MSEVLDKIKSRRSIRKYRSDMIPQDKLEKIIEAGTYAATGMGKQSPIIIAVTNKELRDKLSAMNAKIMGVDNMDPFYGAPVVLIVLADKSRPTCVYDGSLVMGNLMLEAEEQGIGSCWIHRAIEEFESITPVKAAEKVVEAKPAVKATTDKPINVLVLCAGAGTSAMFANAVKEGAKETGLPVDATASAYGNHYDILKNYDVVVLSPQVQAHLEEVKQDAKEGTKVIATKGAQYIQLTRDPKGAVEFIVEQEKEG